MKLKKFNLKLKVLHRNKLESNLCSKIFQLKKTHYKFSLLRQKIWFNNNIQSQDKHLVLLNKKDVIGYNVLKFRKINFKYFRKKLPGKAYIFDTLIIDNKFRNLGLSKLIMNKSNNIIKKKNIFPFWFVSQI